MGLSLVGPGLVDLLIGEEYQASVKMLLPWVASAIFFMGLGAFYAHLPFQLGNSNFGIFKIAAFTAVVNIILNLILIPRMGMFGAAIATLLSFMISSGLGFYLGKKVFPIPFPSRDVIKIVIATLVMGACLYWVKDLRGWHWLFLQLMLGLAAYGAAGYLLNIGGVRQLLAARLAQRAAT
jgi:O-antigen/teichoic acid export membrane protein